MKKILLISTALILMTTFANANSTALTTNISVNANTISAEVAAPPVKSYGWSKKQSGKMAVHANR